MRIKHFAGLVIAILFISGAGIAQANLFGNINSEPATMLLFGTGLVGIAGIRLRSQKKNTIRKNEYSLVEKGS